MELHETAVQVDGCAVLKTALPGRQALSIMPGMGFCWRSQSAMTAKCTTCTTPSSMCSRPGNGWQVMAEPGKRQFGATLMRGAFAVFNLLRI